MNRLHKFTATFAIATLCATPASLWAQAAKDYPNRPVRVIVPSPPGGPPDIIMRMIAPKLSAALGQPVVVDNRPGAGGVVGTAFVAKAPADGYTWLVTTASHTNIPAFNPNVNYDAVRDFTPVTMIAKNFGQALIVHPAVPAKTVQELIALAKREPGKLNYGSAGIGTASHIPAEVMKFETGTDIVGVQYKGVAEVISDLLGGRVEMFFVGTQLALSHVQAGRVRALAVTGPTRWKGMPDVPTMQEAGLKDFSLINWFGLWLPAGAPADIVARLQSEVVKVLAEADIRQQFDTLGLEGVGSKPDDFARFVAKDAAFTLEVARRIKAAAK